MSFFHHSFQIGRPPSLRFGLDAAERNRRLGWIQCQICKKRSCKVSESLRERWFEEMIHSDISFSRNYKVPIESHKEV